MSAETHLQSPACAPLWDRPRALLTWECSSCTRSLVSISSCSASFRDRSVCSTTARSSSSSACSRLLRRSTMAMFSFKSSLARTASSSWIWVSCASREMHERGSWAQPIRRLLAELDAAGSLWWWLGQGLWEGSVMAQGQEGAGVVMMGCHCPSLDEATSCFQNHHVPSVSSGGS